MNGAERQRENRVAKADEGCWRGAEEGPAENGFLQEARAESGTSAGRTLPGGAPRLEWGHVAGARWEGGGRALYSHRGRGAGGGGRW